MIGALPAPKPAPAASRQAALADTIHDRDTWPLTPDEPPELSAATPDIAPDTNAPSAPKVNATPSVTPSAESTIPPENDQAGKIVSGWLPYWDMAEGMRVVEEFPDALTEVSPFWYEVAADGRVADSPGAGNSNVLTKLRSRGKTIIPTIMSADGAALSSVLNDKAKRSLHLKEIVNKIKDPRYDGIDIDYENLPAADKDAFSRFVQDLAVRVHKHQKKLVVTVNSKTSDPGN